ncbi:ABC transporter permease [Fulvivirgaceae bacterium BMA10]|uniref:ABC transporter permease n=1 Tax=Splendidivirga corallicola TaxID=3051826 RepID=A0ABT8KJU7_9BACT|nr:ABC transporter permease [Fulvivirgaceae bacterium BMA10]
MKEQKNIPPKLADRFLSWFCKGELLEEVQGDLYEYYEELIERSKWKRNFLYWFHVFNFLRPFAIKKSRSNNTNFTIMFRHTLLISFRSFIRYKSSFLINLVGLSTGLTSALLIYLWVYDELNVDKFHEKNDRLYQVMEHIQFNEDILTLKETSGPMAEAMIEKLPEVENTVAVAPAHWPGFDNFTLSVEEKSIKATGQYVGKDFFKVFSYGLIYGNKDQVLVDKNAIVISEELAMKLFDTIDGIIGKTVVFQHEEQYFISGVFKQVPANSSVQFDFVLSFERYKDIKPWVADWSSLGPLVYAVLKEGTDITAFNDKFVEFIRDMDKESTRKPFLKAYSKGYLFGNYENGVLVGGRIEYVRLFSIIAFFIVLIACINFMNLSTARASRRSKEIGIKKVVGSRRMELIFQHMGESVLMAFLSLLIAVVFVIITLPYFNQIIGKELTLVFNYNLIFSVFAITLFTGIAAGSYPAFYLSGIRPINTLKGTLSPSMKGRVWARKGLVIFQFVLSIILIVGVGVVYKQIEFIQNKHMGYDRDNIIYFNVEGRVKETMETFLSEVKKIPGVHNASSTAHRMIGKNWTVGIGWEGKNPEDNTRFEVAVVNYDFIETLGIEIKEGRSFSRDFATETTKAIFNEAAIEAMGLSDPIGKKIDFMGKKEIIGVVKNFHFESFHEKLKPFFFIIEPGSENKVMVKLEAGREMEALAGLENFYETYNPGFIFDYEFLDEDFQRQHESELRVGALSRYFAGIAILISCLGLFGLVAFTAERRTKEIGIRKILGSSIWSIVYLLSGNFTKMVLTAIIIALPISYFFAKSWLDDFAYRINLAWWFFVGAGVIALLIALFTVTLQTIKAANVNPVQCLRDE